MKVNNYLIDDMLKNKNLFLFKYAENNIFIDNSDVNIVIHIIHNENVECWTTIWWSKNIMENR